MITVTVKELRRNGQFMVFIGVSGIDDQGNPGGFPSTYAIS